MADAEIYHGARPMPDFVKRGLIQIKGAGMYLKASYVVLWFRSEHPDWAIETSIVQADADFALVKATVSDDLARVVATGHKSCSRAAFPGGHVEKAESGAVARALGFLGYGTEYGEVEAIEEPSGKEPRGARPVPDQYAPMTDIQRAAIESLSRSRGQAAPDTTAWTAAQAAQEIKRLQERAA